MRLTYITVLYNAKERLKVVSGDGRKSTEGGVIGCKDEQLAAAGLNNVEESCQVQV